MIWRLRYTGAARRALIRLWRSNPFAARDLALAIDTLLEDPIFLEDKLRGHKVLYKIKLPPLRVLYVLHD